MQAEGATQTAAPTAPTRRRLLVLVGDPYPGHRHDRADRILARAKGADVLVVAPTLPVPGERWVIDLDARQAQARANLDSWIDALADHAEQIRGELGDERPGLAVADALDWFAADEYLDALGREAISPAKRAPLERLRDLSPPPPAAPALRIGHV
jgi:hypothetical protein